MIRVPLMPLPDQRLRIILGGQDVSLRVYTRGKPEGIYTDLDVSGTDVWRGFIARNLVPCKLYPYLPFAGQLVFVDMQGLEDPRWEGLGSRWLCMYLTDAEAAGIFPERNVRRI